MKIVQIYLVIALIFALLVAVFAVQNTRTVDINFIVWQLKDISLVLVILGSAAIGAVVVFLLGAFKQIKMFRKGKELEREVTALNKEIAELKSDNSTCNEQLKNNEELKEIKEQSSEDDERQPVEEEEKH